jgi:hypothetical protein
MNGAKQRFVPLTAILLQAGKMKKDNFLNGMAFLVLSQFMVGINIVSSKFLLSSTPILFLLVIRFLLAALILLPLHWTTSARQLSIKEHFSQLAVRDWKFIFAQAL